MVRERDGRDILLRRGNNRRKAKERKRGIGRRWIDSEGPTKRQTDSRIERQ